MEETDVSLLLIKFLIFRSLIISILQGFRILVWRFQLILYSSTIFRFKFPLKFVEVPNRAKSIIDSREHSNAHLSTSSQDLFECLSEEFKGRNNLRFVYWGKYAENYRILFLKTKRNIRVWVHLHVNVSGDRNFLKVNWGCWITVVFQPFRSC